MAVTKKATSIEVIDLKRPEMTVWLVGQTPFYCNRMAEKAKRTLLLPSGLMSKGQKATRLKHAPFAEYRDSPYRRGVVGDTRILMVGSAIKKAIATAALEMPTSVAKTQINRLVSTPEEYVPIWGVPRLDMAVVRQAGMNRTPDIRTRARIDHWAMRVKVNWLEPMLTETKIAQLIIAAGMMCGVGDWRQEKGGSAGTWRLAEADDKELLDIIAGGGYLAQEEALREPECSNGETEDLLNWYREEMDRRGLSIDDQVSEDIEVDDPDAPYVVNAAGDAVPIPNGHSTDLPHQREVGGNS